MMPITRDSYLDLRICFSHLCRATLRATAYVQHNKRYLAPSRWQVTVRARFTMAIWLKRYTSIPVYF